MKRAAPYVMSEEAKTLQTSLENNGMTLAEAYRALLELMHRCNCEFKPLTDEELEDKWMSVGARCVQCGTSHGWRCKISPDGVCHYFSNSEGVKLLNGERHKLPEHHSWQNETYDSCIFCDMPEERK